MPTLQLNGKSVNVEAPPDTPLLWVLRDHLGMTGTKFGCGISLCGTYHRIRRAIHDAASRSCDREKWNFALYLPSYKLQG